MNSTESEIAAEITRALFSSAEARKQVNDEVKRVAGEAEAVAKAFAPVLKGPDPREPAGTYRDSIHVEKIVGGKGGFDAYRLLSRDKKAHWIEFGTVAGHRHGATPEFAVFAKTAAQFGGDLHTGIQLDAEALGHEIL